MSKIFPGLCPLTRSKGTGIRLGWRDDGEICNVKGRGRRGRGVDEESWEEKRERIKRRIGPHHFSDISHVAARDCNAGPFFFNSRTSGLKQANPGISLNEVFAEYILAPRAAMLAINSGYVTTTTEFRSSLFSQHQ